MPTAKKSTRGHARNGGAGEDWPDSVLPGERSGEGSDGLFEQIEKDIQRKAGLPRQKSGEQATRDALKRNGGAKPS